MEKGSNVVHISKYKTGLSWCIEYLVQYTNLLYTNIGYQGDNGIS